MNGLYHGRAYLSVMWNTTNAHYALRFNDIRTHNVIPIDPLRPLCSKDKLQNKSGDRAFRVDARKFCHNVKTNLLLSTALSLHL